MNWAVMGCVLTSAMAARASATILVDYGEAAPRPSLEGVWNTVDVGLSGAALIDEHGYVTGVTVHFAGSWFDTTVNQGVWARWQYGMGCGGCNSRLRLQYCK